MNRFISIGRLILIVFLALAATKLPSQVSSTDPNVQAQLQIMANGFAHMQLLPAPHPPALSEIDKATPRLAAMAFIAAHYKLPSDKSLTLKTVATQQTKKQNGAVPNSSASTSLVQKPLGAELLNFAIENGAVLEDVNGTNLSLSSSPYAIIAAFAGDTDTTYAQYSGFARLGLNGSFRIADMTNPTASVNAEQLSNAGATLRLTKDYSYRSEAAIAIFNNKLQKLQQSAVTSSTALESYLANNDLAWKTARDKFNSDADTAISAAVAAQAGKSEPDLASDIEKILAKTFDDDLAGPINADPTRPDAEVKAFLTALPAYIAAVRDFQDALTALTKKGAGSLIYNYQQPTNATAYHETGFTYSGSPMGWGGDVTANALFSFYGDPHKTANQSTFRGATAALELNLKFKRSPFVANAADQSPITLAFAGKYDRIQENQHVAGKKADIGLGNIKLTIPLMAGLSLPISATFANAGQTIKESYVRGNFGITFDMDKLAALLKP